MTILPKKKPQQASGGAEGESGESSTSGNHQHQMTMGALPSHMQVTPPPVPQDVAVINYLLCYLFHLCVCCVDSALPSRCCVLVTAGGDEAVKFIFTCGYWCEGWIDVDFGFI